MVLMYWRRRWQCPIRRSPNHFSKSPPIPFRQVEGRLARLDGLAPKKKAALPPASRDSARRVLLHSLPLQRQDLARPWWQDTIESTKRGDGMNRRRLLLGMRLLTLSAVSIGMAWWLLSERGVNEANFMRIQDHM